MHLSREDILDGKLERLILANDPEMRVLSAEERMASLDAVLEGSPSGDVWVFAYGSLIWNPMVRVAERRVGTVRGYHRSFCLWTPAGRGTVECPGLMLGLERGGACTGVALRVHREEARQELEILWRREMVTGAYRPRLVTVASEAERLKAVAFAINRHHVRYAGGLSEEQVALSIAAAAGVMGRCVDYLHHTVGDLRALGIRDSYLERIDARVSALLAAGIVAAAL